MSKAFLRESDFDVLPELPSPIATLPLGTKNYLTAEGAARLQHELVHLVENVRPPLAANSTDPEARRELQPVDRRIRQVRESLRSAEIVLAAAERPDAVRFGTTATVRFKRGAQESYRIVG